MSILGFADADDAADPAASPLPLPPAWVGLDRMDIPQNNAGDGFVPNSIAWFSSLTDHGNFRFCGAYLTGQNYPNGAVGSQFTKSAIDINRNWVPNVWRMRHDLGWGIVLWYMGYSVTGKYAMPAGIDPVARGKLHALHAKTIVSAIPPALDPDTGSTIPPTLDGAVVVLDNEDPDDLFTRPDRPDQSRIAALKQYYKAFFDQLQQEDAGLPTLRIGVYAHPKIASTLFLADYPQLFAWRVEYPLYGSPRREFPPFKNAGSLLIDFLADDIATTNEGDIELAPVTVGASATQWFAWPMGRQFRNPKTISIPPDNSPLATTAPIIKQVLNWDFNSALVRDPIYPEAEPRIALAADGTLVAGVFSPRDASGTPKPQMNVSLLMANGPLVVPAPAQYVEPDAPIVPAMYHGAGKSYFASVLRNGDIAVFSVPNPTWQTTNSSATMISRRLRRLAFVASDVGNLSLFYVGGDSLLYGMRRTSDTSSWSPPLATGAALRVHPFGAVAAASRATTSVDLFTLNSAGLLTTILWSAASANWSATSQALEVGSGTFLRTTALAAVSATATTLHVFGVGTDLKLRYVEYTGANGWGSVNTLGGATDFVSPHTRIAAHAFSPTRVEVAAVSDTGNVRVHALVYSGTAWAEESPRKELPPPETVKPAGYPVPGGTAATEVAFGWRINPFGDLGIAVVSGVTTVYAAGIARGAMAVLRRTIVGGSEWIHDWQRYR
ncbi:MAG TPA: hypothetical protein VII56_01650 [Rhizomicrobium sp.]